jgi:hypothetical protein
MKIQQTIKEKYSRGKFKSAIKQIPSTSSMTTQFHGVFSKSCHNLFIRINVNVPAGR